MIAKTLTQLQFRTLGMSILVDTGATHNFLSGQAVEELGLQPDDNQEFVVKVGDGHHVKKNGVCINVKLELPNLTVTQDFCVCIRRSGCGFGGMNGWSGLAKLRLISRSM